ncbi:hypothetical protein [Solihabitans fulvus]|uniref:hypothetical protein n=1 Tax=Solihabitans fulvus TaxID=1892852 RepID=UPI001661CA6C|nr:hypothetical protein [Solihabitans fulvus]
MNGSDMVRFWKDPDRRENGRYPHPAGEILLDQPALEFSTTIMTTDDACSVSMQPTGM